MLNFHYTSISDNIIQVQYNYIKVTYQKIPCQEVKNNTSIELESVSQSPITQKGTESKISLNKKPIARERARLHPLAQRLHPPRKDRGKLLSLTAQSASRCSPQRATLTLTTGRFTVYKFLTFACFVVKNATDYKQESIFTYSLQRLRMHMFRHHLVIIPKKGKIQDFENKQERKLVRIY
ncbi:hypothetical protein FGO68_gene7686 [Halteria grandinella]|uniref:Uncharacterized protein n=1 Tax=Halteria grandinella TaxID=5974 RepID=A0A8J8NZT3_HALGN|nr:hypothetical protein FGO68_gene7686 [Halteria grandinella]